MSTIFEFMFQLQNFQTFTNSSKDCMYFQIFPDGITTIDNSNTIHCVADDS